MGNTILKIQNMNFSNGQLQILHDQFLQYKIRNFSDTNGDRHLLAYNEEDRWIRWKTIFTTDVAASLKRVNLSDRKSLFVLSTVTEACEFR